MSHRHEVTRAKQNRILVKVKGLNFRREQSSFVLDGYWWLLVGANEKIRIHLILLLLSVVVENFHDEHEHGNHCKGSQVEWWNLSLKTFSSTHPARRLSQWKFHPNSAVWCPPSRRPHGTAPMCSNTLPSGRQRSDPSAGVELSLKVLRQATNLAGRLMHRAARQRPHRRWRSCSF